MFVFIFPVCQMNTDVGNLWGRWKLFRNTLNSQGRFWLATAEAWWSCGIWAFVTLSSSSWANRYLLQLVLIVLAPSFQGDVIARWPAVMTVCLCVYDPSSSNWRVWYGNALETYLSVPITMEAIQFGLLPVATPAITSQCPPLSPTVRNAHMHTSHVTHSTHLHFKCRSETFSGLEDRVEPVTDSGLHSDENKCFSWELAVAPHTGFVRCIFPSHANCFQNLFTCHFTFLSWS